jgi:S1-C subfamily serine protease
MKVFAIGRAIAEAARWPFYQFGSFRLAHPELDLSALGIAYKLKSTAGRLLGISRFVAWSRGENIVELPSYGRTRIVGIRVPKVLRLRADAPAARLYFSIAPSVVRVRTSEGFASGFAVSPDCGLTDFVATAKHVVNEIDGSNPTGLEVDLPDGRSLPAAVLSLHPESDIALLKVPDAGGWALPAVPGYWEGWSSGHGST